MGGLRSNALRRAFRVDEDLPRRARSVAADAVRAVLVTRAAPDGWQPFADEAEADEAARTLYETARGLALLSTVPDEAVIPALVIWLSDGAEVYSCERLVTLCLQLDKALRRLCAALDESGQDLT